MSDDLSHQVIPAAPAQPTNADLQKLSKLCRMAAWAMPATYVLIIIIGTLVPLLRSLAMPAKVSAALFSVRPLTRFVTMFPGHPKATAALSLAKTQTLVMLFFEVAPLLLLFLEDKTALPAYLGLIGLIATAAHFIVGIRGARKLAAL